MVCVMRVRDNLNNIPVRWTAMRSERRAGPVPQRPDGRAAPVKADIGALNGLQPRGITP